MPKNFSLFGGQGIDQGAISNAIGSAVSAGSQAAGIKANAYAGVTATLVQGIQMAQERKQRAQLAQQAQDFQTQSLNTQLQHAERMQQQQIETEAEQKKLDRAMRAFEFGANMEQGREQAKLDLMGRLGTSAIGQGVQAGPMMNRLLDMANQSGIGMGRLFPTGMGLGAPMGAAQQGGGSGFEDLPMVQGPPSEGDMRRADDDEVASIKRDLEQFVLTPEGQKALMPVKMTRMEAFGWQHFDPKELERAATTAFPQYAPTLGMDGKEDRSGLDTLLKWLKEPQEVQVMTGPGVANMRNSLWGKYNPRTIDRALTERFGNETATSQAQVKEIARAKLLDEMQAQKSASSPASMGVQAGSLSELVTRKQSEDLAGPLGSGPQGGLPLTKDTLEGLNLKFSNLDRSIQSAASIPGIEIKFDPTGRAIVSAPPGQPVDGRLQGEIDKLFNDPSRQQPYQSARAAGELDPAVKRSASDMEKAGTIRGMKTGGGPGEKPKPQGTPADSALARLRARVQAGKTSPSKPKPPKPRIGSKKAPADFSLLGLDSATLQSLLLPGGGR